MKGRRVYPGDDGHFGLDRPGDYGRDVRGVWWAWAPLEDGSRAVGVLNSHTIEEHDDGTITVSPSLVFDTRYHGWLERGEWREA